MTGSRVRRTKDLALALAGDLHLDRGGQRFLANRRIALLEAIGQCGSITAAARRAGLSYKAAWDAVDAMNNLAERPLVVAAVGGARGGGSHLTAEGERAVHLYRLLESGWRGVVGRLQEEMHDLERLGSLLQAIAMRTSARNQLRGTVRRVQRGAVNAAVTLELGDGLEIVATVTRDAVDELRLVRGRAALALIKASWVLLAPQPAPRTSARNCLCGTIAVIKPGAVNTEVRLALAGGRVLTAIVTRESVRALRLAAGAPCCALIKSSHVLIAVND
ncbi:MAG: TOBE domain-containing protein [Gammaproteobacteria bacterium]|nr:TOBE domain-containing protein [Gammaproteobacteria bacterium]